MLFIEYFIYIRNVYVKDEILLLKGSKTKFKVYVHF